MLRGRASDELGAGALDTVEEFLAQKQASMFYSPGAGSVSLAVDTIPTDGHNTAQLPVLLVLIVIQVELTPFSTASQVR